MPHGGCKTNALAPTFGIPTTSRPGALHKRWQVTFRRKSYRVGRLVCLAFKGRPPPGKPFALHRDEDGSNNRHENLYWGTQKENLNAPGFLAYVNSGVPGSRTYIDPTQKGNRLAR
jgi:hypothetical protein